MTNAQHPPSMLALHLHMEEAGQPGGAVLVEDVGKPGAAVHEAARARKGSQRKAFFNLSQAMIGSGLLAIPHVMSQVGVLQSVVLLGLVLSLAGYGMNLILLSHMQLKKSSAERAANVQTVSDLAGALLGVGWQTTVEILTITIQIAFSVGYVYVIMGTAKDIFNMSHTLTAIVILPVAVALGTIRELPKLWFISAVGLLNFVVGVMFGTLFQAFTEQRTLSYIPGNAEKKQFMLSWFSWSGSFLYAAEAVNHMMPNASSLARPADMSMVLVAVLSTYFIFIGGWEILVTMYGFGNCSGKNDSVLVCLSAGHLSSGIRLAVSINLVFSMPISLFPAAQMLENHARSWLTKSLATPRLQMTLTSSVRMLLPMIVIALAITVNQLDAFTGLVGATVMTLLGFVVPVRLHAAAFSSPDEPVGGRFRVVRSVFHAVLVSGAICLAVVETLEKLGISWH